MRKEKLIDKKFQIRTMLSVTVIAAVFFTACIAGTALFSLYAKMRIESEIKQLSRAMETEDDIVKAFTAFAGSTTGSPLKISVGNVLKDHDRSRKTVTSHITMLERLIDWYGAVLLGIIGLAVLALAAYCFYMIRLTHRMSGPIYVMTRHVQDMIDGKETEFRGLRDKDEFRELYKKLEELNDSIKKKP